MAVKTHKEKEIRCDGCDLNFTLINGVHYGVPHSHYYPTGKMRCAKAKKLKA